MFYRFFYCFLLFSSLNFSVQAAKPELVNELPVQTVKTFDQEVAEAKKDSYLTKLISTSTQLNLDTAPTWIALMHYKKSFFTQLESQVDGMDFFMSENGKFDSTSELNATLAAFFSTQPVAPTKYSPQCRFPARYLWLKEVLKFDTKKLPEQECDALKKYYAAMDPASLTVVFPSTHPNSPSSMFGHTLLRVNKKGQTENTRMLAFSINYAAQIAPDEGMLSYSVLGLTGGFPGKFMILPYYVKLREYAQIENRDLWEYDLNIPPEKLKIILYHTFELAYSYFDYYFFTENCSYHLLSLLDVAYPENPMSDEFNGWVIPVDTLTVLENRNLLKHARFYPSIARKLNFRKDRLSKPQLDMVLLAQKQGISSIKEPLLVLDKKDQIQVLDLLTELLRFEKIRLSEQKVSSKLSKSERDVLLFRSRIPIPSETLRIEPPGIHPAKGHATNRLGLIYGQIDKIDIVDFEWRPAYHDILDPSAGFVSSSGVDFFKIKLRYEPESTRMTFQELTMLNIESLEPRNEFFKTFSWRGHARWLNQSPLLSKTEKSVFDFSAGVGLTYQVPKKSKSLLYTFFDSNLLASANLNKKLSIIPSLQLGYIMEPIQGWRINMAARYGASVIGKNLENKTIEISQSRVLTQQLSARLNIKRRWQASLVSHQIEAKIYYYF